MSLEVRIGLLGGTLDPIHVGHVETATVAREALTLTGVYVLPSHVPPHRSQQPVASGYHRFAMTALAVNGVAGLAASDVELRTPGPSYTADTLSRFHERSGLGASQIFFITGADAFAEIATWRRYPEVLDLAQFVVISRPGFAATALPGQMPALAARMTTGGRGSAAAADASIFLVDAATRDISSTHIRARLARGETAARLVPDLVEAHIVQHGLYAGSPRHGSTRTTADHLHGQD
jgi:nicotinate-nucleotide adenylyltransferase